MDWNVMLGTDSYKVSHWKQYPPGSQYVYSYFESRGGKFPTTVFFGLQYIIKKYLCGCQVTEEKIQDATKFYKAHFGTDEIFYEKGWRHILEQHGGFLPVKIKAVPEGSVIPNKNVLFTVENTDPDCPWLTNHLETLLVQAWYPVTVASNSRACKEVIGEYLKETSENLDSLPFKLVDFGYRGSTSQESAAIGGSAHLVNFQSTDTMAGIRMVHHFYHSSMPGFSIPAAEHSTITSWGKDGECKAFENMLKSFPNGPLACVSDSYDIYNAVENYWGKELKNLVIERGSKPGNFLVVRPDSGDPPQIVVEVLDRLGTAFGTRTNSQGYRVLPDYIRVIQGDGISYESLGSILENMKKNKWSAENVTFGSGGALLQRVDRDTQKMAFKCSHITINGEGRNVYKDPVTDTGKKSKRGRLTLELRDGEYVTVEEGEGREENDLMQTVYLNGKLLIDQKFDDIKKRAEIDIVKSF